MHHAVRGADGWTTTEIWDTDEHLIPLAGYERSATSDQGFVLFKHAPPSGFSLGRSTADGWDVETLSTESGDQMLVLDHGGAPILLEHSQSGLRAVPVDGTAPSDLGVAAGRVDIARHVGHVDAGSAIAPFVIAAPGDTALTLRAPDLEVVLDELELGVSDPFASDCAEAPSGDNCDVTCDEAYSALFESNYDVEWWSETEVLLAYAVTDLDRTYGYTFIEEDGYCAPVINRDDTSTTIHLAIVDLSSGELTPVFESSGAPILTDQRSRGLSVASNGSQVTLTWRTRLDGVYGHDTTLHVVRATLQQR